MGGSHGYGAEEGILGEVEDVFRRSGSADHFLLHRRGGYCRIGKAPIGASVLHRQAGPG